MRKGGASSDVPVVIAAMQAPYWTPVAHGLDTMESTDVGDGVPPVRGHRCAPGERIGPYLVERTIGSGAMGVVYAAIDPTVDPRSGQAARVAVKLMHPRGYYVGGDATLSRRADAWLRNEARALARLSHPNVIGVRGIGQTRGQPYLAMEFVAGCTLAAWLEAGPRGWVQVLRVCMAAAEGLAAAHRAGIMHGDFKPDNVMVADDGRVLVMDFGLSRSMSRQARAATHTALSAVGDEDLDDTQRSAAVDPRVDDDHDDDWETVEDTHPEPSRDRLRRRPGTPAYMAPEALAGYGGDTRSDQFSLCVTMYKALFGRRPYGGRTPAEIAFRIGRHDLRQAPAGDVPIWLHAMVTRGLAVQPQDRWRSVQALLTALRHGMARHRRQRTTRLAAILGATVALATVLTVVVARLLLMSA